MPEITVYLTAVDEVTPAIEKLEITFTRLGESLEEAARKITDIIRAYNQHAITAAEARRVFRSHDYTGHKHRGTRAWERRYKHKGSPS